MRVTVDDLRTPAHVNGNTCSTYSKKLASLKKLRRNAERPAIASCAQLRQHELGHYNHRPRAVTQRQRLTGHDARSRSKTSYTHWVRFRQSMHSARLDTRYLAESFSRMSDLFNLAMYKRYISLLLEYNSAFFVIAITYLESHISP
jgi:hypothetical protein